MACTSAAGTASAARTWAWDAGRAALALGAALSLVGNEAPPPGATLLVRIEGLRSTKGMVRACLTRNAHFFPSCDKDPDALHASVAAGPEATLHIGGIPSGDYALAVLHDENGNGRIDTVLGIPRDGVGFSQNPRLFFGPPKFAAVRFHIGTVDVVQHIRMRYFL